MGVLQSKHNKIKTKQELDQILDAYFKSKQF